MKKKLLITINALLAFGVLQAQIVNLGGTITVQSGATLVVEGNVDNQSGTIANSGTIEIKGNFNNAAAGTTLSGTGSYIFNGGTANATITTNGDAINNLTIDKSGFDVLLLDSLTVNGALTFGGAGNSNLVLGAHKLILGNLATLDAGSPAGYVEADGMGVVVKNHSSTIQFTLPIGDVDDFSPISFTPSSSTSGSISARVVDAVHPNNVGTTYITRYWPVTNTVAGTFAGTYLPSEVIGVGNMSGYRRTGSTWIEGTGVSGNMATVSAVPNTHDIYAQSAGIKDFILTAYLQGPLDSLTQTMSTTLRNTLGLGTAPTAFPTLCPYGTGATNNSIPTDVVDWVLVQVVDSSNSNTIYGQTSAFLRSNGLIIPNSSTTIGSTTPLTIMGISQTNGSIRIKHRNHLSVRTRGIVWVNEPNSAQITFNFATENRIFTMTSGLGTAPSAIHPQRPYAAGFRALWAGDINQDGFVKYNLTSNDRGLILVAIGGSSLNSTVSGYYNEDCNLDVIVKYNLTNNDRGIILQNIGGNSLNPTLKSHN